MHLGFGCAQALKDADGALLDDVVQAAVGNAAGYIFEVGVRVIVRRLARQIEMVLSVGQRRASHADLGAGGGNGVPGGGFALNGDVLDAQLGNFSIEVL